MTATPTPGAGWLCPACDRHVPSKVNECRCGFARAGGAEPGHDEPSGDAASASPSRAIAVVLSGIGLVAAAAWFMMSGQPGRSQAAAGRSVALAAPSAAQAAASAASPAEAPAPATRQAEFPTAPLAPPAEPAVTSLEDVISRALPAVVRVETSAGTGSGFFVDADTILTNVHVVAGSSSVTIRRSGGSTAPARVASLSPDFDIAVLKITNPAPDQATIPLGSTSTARVGQEVIAIGSALGMLQNTVTRGIVSGIRQIGSATLVQNDAALNPGNSGGPLLDRTGAAIGINTLGFRGAQGLNFAVSIDHARALLEGRPHTPPAPATGSSSDTALRNLSPALPSDTDRQRAQGVRGYEQAIAQIARRADSLDNYWERFKANCFRGRIVGAFDREWFAIWQPRAMDGTVSPGCGSAFGEVQRLAGDIRSQIIALEEAARQADVYPGTRRELRKRYRLDHSAWDR